MHKKVFASLINLSQYWRVMSIISFKWNLYSFRVWQTLYYLKYQFKIICKYVGIFIFITPVLGLMWIKSSIFIRNECSFLLRTKAKTEFRNIPPLCLISQLSLRIFPLHNYHWSTKNSFEVDCHIEFKQKSTLKKNPAFKKCDNQGYFSSKQREKSFPTQKWLRLCGHFSTERAGNQRYCV